jgi:hypothetical protein
MDSINLVHLVENTQVPHSPVNKIAIRRWCFDRGNCPCAMACIQLEPTPLSFC